MSTRRKAVASPSETASRVEKRAQRPLPAGKKAVIRARRHPEEGPDPHGMDALPPLSAGQQYPAGERGMTMAIATSVGIRVLSVHQPFASAFFDNRPHRRKFVENRTWTTPYRGTIYIHASRLERRPKDDAVESELELAMWDDPPPCGLPVGQIIGSVRVVEVLDGETLELLSETPHDATTLPEDVRRCLYPSQRAGWLEKWQSVRDFLFRATISVDQFYAHCCGPECWLVDQPRLLRTPITTGGKLNLWRMEVDPDSLAVR